MGFILALLCRDLAYFLGNPIMGRSGPSTAGYLPIPLLKEIPMQDRFFLSAGHHDLFELPAGDYRIHLYL